MTETKQRFPEDLLVTATDVDIAEIEAFLAKDEEYGYSSYHSTLSKAARDAMDNGETAKGKCLWLLADACSMMLESNSLNTPFRPFCVMDGKRSSIPEDFSGKDMDFFESIIEKIQHPRLKARLADILWLLKHPRRVVYALTAVENYRLHPLDHDGLLKDGREIFERAIRISLMLGQPAAEQLSGIEASLFIAFNASVFSEGYRALWLADLLMLITRIAPEKSIAIPIKLEAFSEQAKSENDYYKCRNFLQGAREWNQRLKKTGEINRLTATIAETWVSEAEARSADSNMVAGSFYEDAIKEYRKIPTKYRSVYIDPIGANLRNEIAHGLAETEDLLSLHCVYLWWLCLRLMINSIPWQQREKHPNDVVNSKSEPD